MPTNEPPSVSREEQELVRRQLERAVEILQPAREQLTAQGFRNELVANEEAETVTLTLVVHTKWPTTI